MEICKPLEDLIIDKNYKPSLQDSKNLMDYFNRAMAFTSNNYHERIVKLSKNNFYNLAPTKFFNEYLWCAVGNELPPQSAYEDLVYCIDNLQSIYYSFSHPSYPDDNDTKQKLSKVILNETTVNNILKTAKIISQGIDLYGWEFYKNNFLNTIDKLSILPLLTISKAQHLVINLSIDVNVVPEKQLHKIADYWGQKSTTAMCNYLQSHVSMRKNIISLIVWYAAAAFDANLLET